MDTSGIGEIARRTSAGFWSWNLYTGEIQFSDSLLNLLGLSPEESESNIEFWFRQLHPDEVHQIQQNLFRCTDGTDPVFSAQHRIRHKSGEWINAIATGGLVKTEENGDHSCFVCILNTVITQRRIIDFTQIQSDLREVLRKQGTVQEIMDDVCQILSELSIVDACGFYISDSGEGQTSLVAHKGLPEWYIERGPSVVRSSGMIAIMESEEPSFPVYSENSPFRDLNSGSGSVFINAVLPFNLTEERYIAFFIASKHLDGFPRFARREMEETISLVFQSLKAMQLREDLRLYEEKYSVLLESIGNPVIGLNDELRVLFYNSSVERLIEPSPKRLTGRRLEDLLSGVMEDIFFHCIEQVKATGEVYRTSFEYKDVYWEITLSPTGDGFLAILRNMTARETARERLAYRERLEKLLMRISTDFIGMKGYTLNSVINDAILEIGMMIGADRGCLFRFDTKLQTMSVTHEWCAFNIEPQSDRLQNLICAHYPWWMESIRKLRTVVIPLVDELPPDADAEREILSKMNILSQVMIPLVHGSDLIGILAFDSLSRSRSWSEDIIDLLRIAGDAIANAMERNRMENQLQSMYDRVELDAEAKSVLLREVNHRVKNNLSEIIGLLYAQMRYQKEAEVQTDFIPSLINRIQGLATVHSMLSESGWNPLSLSALIRQIMENSISNLPSVHPVEIDVTSSSVKVNSNQAHALALIFNELVRNSLKHTLSEEAMSISVVIDSKGYDVHLRYSDDGPGYPEDVMELKRVGLGLSLVKNIVSKNLHGQLRLLSEGGAVAEIKFSLKLQEDDDG